MRATPLALGTAALALGLVLAGLLFVQAGPPAEAGFRQDQPTAPDAPGSAPTGADAGSDRPVARVTDPEGDADPAGAGDAAPRAACEATGACDDAPEAAEDRPATPAPHQDITHVDYDGEDPDALHFTLGLVALRAGWADLEAPSGVRVTASWSVCWSAGPAMPCDHTVRLVVDRHHGVARALATLRIDDPACNAWGACEWPVDAVARPGTPATIRFAVPQALLGAEPGSLHGLAAETAWAAYPTLPLVAGIEATLPGLLPVGPAAAPGRTGWTVADTTARLDRAVPLAGTATGGPLGRTGPALAGPPGTLHGPDGGRDHPALDLVWVHLAAATGRVRVAFELRDASSWPADPVEHRLLVGLPGGAWEVLHRHEGGTSLAWVAPCGAAGCRAEDRLPVPVEVAGRQVRVRVPTDVFADPDAGAVTTYLVATSHLLGPAPGVRHLVDALPPADPFALPL